MFLILKVMQTIRLIGKFKAAGHCVQFTEFLCTVKALICLLGKKISIKIKVIKKSRKLTTIVKNTLLALTITVN